MRNVKVGLAITLSILCAALVFAGQAHALLINPGMELYRGDEGDATGVTNNQNDIDAFLASAFEPDLVELYKNDLDDGESGPLLASYETTFSNTATDPSAASIEYMGGPYITDAYLLVKDGRHSPYWYLFDLTALNWNGTDALELSGFWLDQGAISHVALYGEAVSVPEPATLLLLGVGLVGIAGVSRRKFVTKS
jgi:hypothetical protein